MIKLVCILMYWGEFTFTVDKLPFKRITVSNGISSDVNISKDYLNDEIMNWVYFKDLQNGYSFTIPMTCKLL